MEHRHLNPSRLTTAAVDDIIRRGGWRDWVRLRRAARADPVVVSRIQRVCAAAGRDRGVEGAQRLAFWNLYVQRLTASLG